jgi:hypothetical protein
MTGKRSKTWASTPSSRPESKECARAKLDASIATPECVGWSWASTAAHGFLGSR